MEILGIDVGGSGIKGAIIDINKGELVSEKHRIPTPEEATPEAVAETVSQLIKHFNWKGEVGCGFPTPLKHGKCITSGNLHTSWKGTHVNKLFEQYTGNEFTVVNDADAAGLAEISFGAGKNVEGVVVVITIGTGIGSAVFLDGNLLQNTELGHVLYKNGKSYEKYAADSVRKKEKLSRKQWGKRLNKYFKHINLLLSPDLFIIGGGASKKLDSFKNELELETPIVAAEAENEAGIIGAAMAANFHIK